MTLRPLRSQPKRSQLVANGGRRTHPGGGDRRFGDRRRRRDSASAEPDWRPALAGLRGALAVSLPSVQRPMLGWVAAIAGGFILGALVRPGGLIEVVVWFALAGAVVVIAAADRVGAWALLVPAIYLPVHLLIGIGRAILRNGGVRTDPPPTAAIVPLAMLLAAAAAGALVAAVVRRGR